LWPAPKGGKKESRKNKSKKRNTQPNGGYENIGWSNSRKKKQYVGLTLQKRGKRPSEKTINQDTQVGRKKKRKKTALHKIPLKQKDILPRREKTKCQILSGGTLISRGGDKRLRTGGKKKGHWSLGVKKHLPIKTALPTELRDGKKTLH